jgi:hypothetical protein
MDELLRVKATVVLAPLKSVQNSNQRNAGGRMI